MILTWVSVKGGGEEAERGELYAYVLPTRAGYFEFDLSRKGVNIVAGECKTIEEGKERIGHALKGATT
jgi:hypothetical protein